MEEKYCKCGKLIKGTGGIFTFTGNIEDMFCSCPPQQNNQQYIPPQQKEPVIEKDPHEYSRVQCDLCSHKWRAVRAAGLTKLECPNCRNIAHIDIIAP